MPRPGIRSVHSVRYRSMLARLRAARLEAGLTQEQVARALHREQSFVSKSERGERRIDPIDLADFAVLYRKSIEFFLRESGKGTS